MSHPLFNSIKQHRLPTTVVLSLALSMLSGCASMPSTGNAISELRWVVSATPTTHRDKPLLAVVLSSGALRGYAHIGVMRAFEKAGIQPDMIVGTSVGAIVGSLWASGMPAQKVERIADELGMNVFSDWSPTIWQIAQGNFKGLVSGNAIEHFVLRQIPEKTIEELPVRFAVVAADLHSGEPVRINGGSLTKAVRASAGVPVLLTPVTVTMQGQVRELVDGGLVEPLPVKTARQMGADIVVAVDVVYRPSEAHIWSPVDVSFQSLQIAINALRREQLPDVDVLITPKISERDVSHSGAKQLIAEGERAAAEVMADLKVRLKIK